MNTKNTYILVHGSWHGSWCWRRVAKQLRELGHDVITPDLPGHYKNKMDLGSVQMETYVRSIQGVVTECMRPVILVGHSMGGVVVTQVAENIPDKVSKLIYVSAFLPQTGSSLMDEVGKALAPSDIGNYVIVDGDAGTMALPDGEKIREIFYNCCKDEDVQFALSHIQKQPLHSHVGKISYTERNLGRIPKLYIECLQDKAINILDQRRMRDNVICDVETLDTDHSPFFSKDEELVRMLVG